MKIYIYRMLPAKLVLATSLSEANALLTSVWSTSLSTGSDGAGARDVEGCVSRSSLALSPWSTTFLFN